MHHTINKVIMNAGVSIYDTVFLIPNIIKYRPSRAHTSESLSGQKPKREQTNWKADRPTHRQTRAELWQHLFRARIFSPSPQASLHLWLPITGSPNPSVFYKRKEPVPMALASFFFSSFSLFLKMKIKTRRLLQPSTETVGGKKKEWRGSGKERSETWWK